MSEALDKEIRTLRAQFWSARDPEGRAFVPLADAYRRKGELDEAAALVEDGLARLPDFTPGHLVAARIQRAKGDLEGARTALDRVLEMDGENILALLERAELARDTGDPEQAVKGLRALLSLDPSHVGARAALDGLESTGGGAAAPLHVEEPAAFEPVDGTIEPADLEPADLEPADGTIEPADFEHDAIGDPGADGDEISPLHLEGLERTGEADPGLEETESLEEAETDEPFTAEELLDPDDLFLGEGQSDGDGPVDEAHDELLSPQSGSATSTGDLDVFDFEFLVEEDARDRAEDSDIVSDALSADAGPADADAGSEEVDGLLVDADREDPGLDAADLELRDDGIHPEDPHVDFARTEPVDDGPESVGAQPEAMDAPLEAADEQPEPIDAEVVPADEEAQPADARPEAADEQAATLDAEVVPADEERAPLVTRTMAEIFVRQGLLDRGVEIYERLVADGPDRAELRDRLDEIEAMRREEEEERAAYGAESTEAAGGTGSDQALTLEEEDPADVAPQWAGEETGRDGDAEAPTPFAWSESEEGQGPAATDTETRTIRDHFADLLSWVPGAVPIADLAPGAAPGSTPETAVPIAELAPGAAPGAFPETAVPIESLAPDPAPAGAVPVEDPAPDPPEITAVPIQDLAPGAPPATAPAGSPAAARAADPGAPASDGDDADDQDFEGFEAWLEGFRR